MIKHLCFDFDGTITDTHHIAVRSLSRVFDELGHNIKQNDILHLIGDKIYAILKALKINPGHLDLINKKFWGHYKKGISSTEIKPCVSLEPLKQLHESLKLSIVSNSETSVINRTLKILGAKELFSGVYGVEKFATKDQMLRKLIKKHKIASHEMIYIGDRYSDIEAAKKAGCYSVAIHNKYSWSDIETIKKEDPDFIIRDFRGIKRVLKEIKKKTTASTR